MNKIPSSDLVDDLLQAGPIFGRVEWLTRDKQLLAVADMTPEHRANVVKMLKPRIEAWQFKRSLYYALMAEDMSENAADRLMQASEDMLDVRAEDLLRATPLGIALFDGVAEVS